MLRCTLLVGLLAALVPGVRAAGYRDVPRQHWAFAETQWVRSTGIIPASGGADFKGDKGMNRYEMAQVLSGYMRKYYSKRDQIAARIQNLKETGVEHAAQLAELETRAREVTRRMDELSGSPAAFRVPGTPPPTREPAPARSSSLRDRLAALRAKVRASRGGVAPERPAPVADERDPEKVWDAF